MGIFTYRKAAQTKREVQALRADQANQAASSEFLTLFQQLPPEGKDEIRALQEEHRGKWYDGMIQSAMKRDRLAKGCRDVFRRYDLIP